MKLRDKIHTSLQKKVLDKAIKQLTGDIGDYYIDENRLLFRIKEEKVKLLNELNFVLPSWEEISKVAKKYYKNFDETVATKIVYEFSYLTQEKDLVVNAKNSDIVLGNNNFTNLIIKDANNVKIYGDPIENGELIVNAKNIEVMNMAFPISKGLKLTSEFILFSRINLASLKNVNIDSKFVEFYHSSIICADTLNIKSDLILCEKAKLNALNKIEIINSNCDEIKSVSAPTIIYNGQDISYSEGIVMPKLRRNLIEVLCKTKNKVSNDLKYELEMKTEKIKEELNNKPITKILKK